MRRSARSSSPALVRTARDREGRCVVVLTVRADFYGRCAAYPELSRLLGANHVLVGQMSRDELRRTIERPAQRAGLTVEPELVEALLTDVEGRPGALPLLSTALLELWSGRDGSRLRLAAYARSGGVQGAVARMAEDAFVRLDPAQQAETRKLMLRLADEDESGAIVRRRLELAELDSERSREVVDRLADRRLLTVSRRRRRGRPRGAAARMAAAARLAGRGRPGPAAASPACASPRARGTLTIATPVSSTAARASPRRSSGRPVTRTS